MVTRRKRSASRRRKTTRRRRKNPWYNDRKGHAKAAKKGWATRRRKKAKSTTSKKRKSTRKRVRKNPSYTPRSTRRVRRRRRAVRLNPPTFLRKIGLTRSNIKNAATIGAGIGVGYLGMPLMTRFAPPSMQRHRKFFGLVHVLLGGLLFAGGRRGGSPLRLMGTTVAGMGFYDLLASNLPLGLPVLPSNLPAGMLSDAIPEPSVESSADEDMGASYPRSLGANYNPPALIGASYTPPSFQTEGLGADDPFDGVWE